MAGAAGAVGAVVHAAGALLPIQVTSSGSSSPASLVHDKDQPPSVRRLMKEVLGRHRAAWQTEGRQYSGAVVATITV